MLAKLHQSKREITGTIISVHGAQFGLLCSLWGFYMQGVLFPSGRKQGSVVGDNCCSRGGAQGSDLTKKRRECPAGRKGRKENSLLQTLGCSIKGRDLTRSNGAGVCVLQCDSTSDVFESGFWGKRGALWGKGQSKVIPIRSEASGN